MGDTDKAKKAKPQQQQNAPQQAPAPAADANKPANISGATTPKASDPNKPDNISGATAPKSPTATKVRFFASFDKAPTGDDINSDKHAALWFNPVTIESMSPRSTAIQHTVAVVAGQNEREIASLDAPLNQHGISTGDLTANLDFATDSKELNRSISITVKGNFPATKRATINTAAKKHLQDHLNDPQGDVLTIAAQVKSDLLAAEAAGYDIDVTIAENTGQTGAQRIPIGSRTVYYKAHDNPAFSLKAVPEQNGTPKDVTWSQATTTDDGNSADLQAGGDVSGDTDNTTRNIDDNSVSGGLSVAAQRYHEEVKQTYASFVSAVDQTFDAEIRDVVNTLTRNDTIKDNWAQSQHTIAKKDFDKTTKATDGDETDKNWASKLGGAVDAAKGVMDKVVGKVDDIPILNKIPGVKWAARHVNEIGLALDAAGAVTDAFKSETKAHVKKEEEKGHENDDTTDHIKGHETVTVDGTDTLTSHLTDIKNQWKTHLQVELDRATKTTDQSSGQVAAHVEASKRHITDDTKKTKTHADAHGDVRLNHHDDKRTTTTVTVNTKKTPMTFALVPARSTATDGEGEISLSPFAADGTQDADDKAKDKQG